MSHTKGKWKIDTERTTGGAPVITANSSWMGHTREVAKVLYHGGSEDHEVYHNAKLIAAAPQLLEALKNALNVMAAVATGDLKTINRDSAAIQQARAAIAQAEGKE